jgi:large subunit ribosomal protein L19
MKQIVKDLTHGQLIERTRFKVGDGVRVHTKVREGDKERIQMFSGIVIARRGEGISENLYGSPHRVWRWG